LAEIRVLDGGVHHQVHRTLKHRLQVFQQPKVGIRVLIEGKILESHHKVQIAFRWIKFRSGSGAEEVDAALMALAADAFQFLALFFYQAVHAFSPRRISAQPHRQQFSDDLPTLAYPPFFYTLKPRCERTRLIAAAPELLKALQDIIAEFWEEYEYPDRPPQQSPTVEAVRKAEHVSRKAKGEETTNVPSEFNRLCQTRDLAAYRAVAAASRSCGLWTKNPFLV
jgi:hypothetical protein